MPSKARASFDKNVEDIKRLMGLHEREGGTSPGRRYGLEVLNKSAVVLITSCWEAFCEDLAAEALQHIVKYSSSADALPTKLRKSIAKELEDDKNELAIWKVANGNWKKYLQSRLEKLQEARNWNLNSPKYGNIDRLFESAIGIKEISKTWGWTGITCARSRIKLNKYVTLRGSIAHRGQSSKSVKKAQVDDYLGFVRHLATKTGGKVNTYVKNVTGIPLWRK